MIAVAACGTLAAGFLGVLAVGLWRDYLITQELAEATAEYESAVADALDLAFDPDHEDFRQWSDQLAWPEYRPGRGRPWIEPGGLAG